MKLDNFLQKLAQAHRILASQGHGDGTLGHVSFRDPDGRGLWLKRAEIGMDEVAGADDLLLVSFDGSVRQGKGDLHSEWPIHASVMLLQQHVQSVVHTHARHASLLSAARGMIEPLTTEGGYFALAPVRNYEAPQAHIDDDDSSRAMAAFLGTDTAILVRNHGLVTCGKTIEFATLTALYIERAAAIQISALGCPGIFYPATPQQMANRALMLKSTRFVEQNFAYYARTSDRLIINGATGAK